MRHDKRGVLVAEEAPDGSTIEHPLPARLVDQVRLVHHAVDGSVDKTRSRGVRSRVRSWF